MDISRRLVQEQTKRLRRDPGVKWSRLREFLNDQGVDPERAVLATMDDDGGVEAVLPVRDHGSRGTRPLLPSTLHRTAGSADRDSRTSRRGRTWPRDPGHATAAYVGSVSGRMSSGTDQ
jgi:hypothetical protein